jgi:hypothetical protein
MGDDIGLEGYAAIEFALSLPMDPHKLIEIGADAEFTKDWTKGHWALYSGYLAAALHLALEALEKP